jgi:hypothetical protein
MGVNIKKWGKGGGGTEREGGEGNREDKRSIYM